MKLDKTWPTAIKLNRSAPVTGDILPHVDLNKDNGRTKLLRNLHSFFVGSHAMRQVYLSTGCSQGKPGDASCRGS